MVLPAASPKTSCGFLSTMNLSTWITPLALSAALCAQSQQTSYVYDLKQQPSAPLKAFLESRFDVLHRDAGQSYRIVVAPGELQQFLAAVPTAVFIERGQPFAAIAKARAAQSPVDAPDANYYTVAEITQEIDKVVTINGAIAKRVDLTLLPGAAKTHQGRSIYALKVSDNVNVDEDEPAILIAAQHHARELNSPHIVVGAMNRIVQGYLTDPALKAVVDKYEIYLVPMVNPDGVNHVWTVDNYWRKNRRNNGGGRYGVDLNRNFEFLWGACGASSNTGSSIYKGPSALSEPETRTMDALGQFIRPEIYLDIHSSGREVLFTYAPCANLTTTMRNFINAYVNDLRAPMNFATRAPSASGEAPEHHWGKSGAISFLTEIGTSFQPAFSSTVAEEARVWPGISRALTTWNPALRGHVRSIFKGQAIEAKITYTPNLFNHGEKAMSRSRDGRYGLWLPKGSYQVTWQAAGFRSVTRSVTVTQLNQSQSLEIEMIPAWIPATLVASGSNQTGTTTSLTYTASGDAGLLYWVALSMGTSPGISVGSRTIPMRGDALLAASIHLPPVLTNNLGNLPGTSQAVAAFNIPPLAGLVGLQLYACGLSFESGYPQGVKRWSQPVPLTIQ